MKEIRIHGRGGQGAVVAGQILVEARVRDGKWASGYHVSTVGRNEEAIRQYIKEQEREDRRIDQLKLY